MSAWTEHVAKWRDCQKCPLCRQRDRICLARGDVPCDVLFIGEAPGSSEDALGEPFRGPAGRLLDQIVDRALSRWQAPGTSGPEHNAVACAMTNLVACFPAEAKARGDNEPERAEILACRPRLVEFVNIARPRLIVCVGELASGYVDHGGGVPCVDVVHPAFILRKEMPQVKKQAVIHHMTVMLRGAVETAMATPNTFTNWGARYASLTAGEDMRKRYDAWARAEADTLPF